MSDILTAKEVNSILFTQARHSPDYENFRRVELSHELLLARKPKLFAVTHQCFGGFTTTLVEAMSAKEALKKYNALAKTRKEYPYMWNEVELDSVRPAEVVK